MVELSSDAMSITNDDIRTEWQPGDTLVVTMDGDGDATDATDGDATDGYSSDGDATDATDGDATDGGTTDGDGGDA
jgi:hypothetical protein